MAADFGYKAGGLFIGHIYQTLDPSREYAVKSTAPYIPDIIPIRNVRLTLWGVPGDPSHDPVRAFPQVEGPDGKPLPGPEFGAHVEGPYRPLLNMPMDCGVDNGPFLYSGDSWNNPGELTDQLPAITGDVNVTGCDDERVRFNPAINLQPTDRSAGGPTGLDVHLEVEQRDQSVQNYKFLYPENEQLHGIDTPPMKKVVTTFPEGMTISTSAAQGLGVCSSAQLALGTNKPVTCPDNSQYGQLTLHTPILPPDEPMRGYIYIAKKGDNPYNNFLSMYFVIEEPERDLRIKIPGKLDLDPVTGQIKVTFDELPQFPLSDMQLTFKGGVRSALAQPRTCGKKVITADFYSWADPTTPHRVSSFYDVTKKADGSPCVNNLSERGFDVQMSAGTVNPNAASYSPFIFRMTRGDDDQELSQITTQMPPGLTAKLAGLTLCPEEAIEAAANPLRTGVEEREFPSCPASSQVGTTEVGSGVGVPLTYINGSIYFAGPYKGAPLSIVVISPILPGPYDLGNIVVRSAVHVDRSTTAVKVSTDPFPQIYQGIPVRIRDIRLKIDRNQVMLNPTNCDPKTIGAYLTGAGGDVNTTADDTADVLTEPFQVANCSALDFRPRLSFKLKGGTGRGDHPALAATLVTQPGDANMRKVSVTLPPSTFIDQGHIRTVCTRVQYAADECPQGSIYGFAKAWSPLLDQPVEGPVILRSSNNPLPDLVMDLKGIIDVNVVGRIDSINARNRTTFEGIPDQPVSKFTLNLQGGGKGLLVNSKDLCSFNGRAKVLIDGQNGKTADHHPKLKNGCAQEARRKRKASASEGSTVPSTARGRRARRCAKGEIDRAGPGMADRRDADWRGRRRRTAAALALLAPSAGALTPYQRSESILQPFGVPSGLAVDQSNGDVYIGTRFAAGFLHFDATTEVTEVLGEGQYESVAVNPVNGNVYALTRPPFPIRVESYDEEGEIAQKPIATPAGRGIIGADSDGNVFIVDVGAINEQQKFTVAATGGNYTLTFDGQETAPLEWNAGGFEVETALAALSKIGAENVSVSQSGQTYTLSFQNALANTNLPLVSADSTNLIEGSVTKIETVVDGSNARALDQRVRPQRDSQTGAQLRRLSGRALHDHSHRCRARQRQQPLRRRRGG